MKSISEIRLIFSFQLYPKRRVYDDFLTFWHCVSLTVIEMMVTELFIQIFLTLLYQYYIKDYFI